MQTFLILLIFSRLYEFFNYRSIARLAQDMRKFMESKQDDPDLDMTNLTEQMPHYFLIALASDLLYLCFCIYLMFSEDTWTPGVLLLLIASLESYSTFEKIPGTCYEAKDGYTYPALWWRYMTVGSSLFILTRLLEVEKILAQ